MTLRELKALVPDGWHTGANWADGCFVYPPDSSFIVETNVSGTPRIDPALVPAGVRCEWFSGGRNIYFNSGRCSFLWRPATQY